MRNWSDIDGEHLGKGKNSFSCRGFCDWLQRCWNKYSVAARRLAVSIREGRTRSLVVNRNLLNDWKSGHAEKKLGWTLTNIEKNFILSLIYSRLFWLSEWVKWGFCPQSGRSYNEIEATRFKQKQVIEHYSLLKLLVLSFILVLGWVLRPILGGFFVWCLGIPIVTAVAYMLLESIAATLYVQFVGTYDRADPIHTPNRSIILLLVAYLDLIAGFAFVYIWSNGVLGPCATTDKQVLFTSLWDSLYFSTVTITTLGYGDFHPITFCAQVSVVLQSLSGILLLVLMLATFINALPRRTTSLDRRQARPRIRATRIPRIGQSKHCQMRFAHHRGCHLMRPRKDVSRPRGNQEHQ